VSRVVIPSKFLGESPNVKFDFTSSLAPTETISTQVCTATVYSGTDSSPQSIIAGAASASGQVVTQRVIGGVVGVIYELKCTITTSLGQTLQLVGYLPVLPDLV
jgi:hypothetical protein